MVTSRLKASLIICNIPAHRTEASRRFWGSLLGIDEFARGLNPGVESYFAPISEDGIDLNITQRFDELEGVALYFAVENLDETVLELEGLGGERKTEVLTVKIGPDEAKRAYEEDAKAAGFKVGDSIGTMVVMLDPDRNTVGLIQLEEHARPHFRVGRHQHSLGQDQVESFAKAIEAGSKV